MKQSKQLPSLVIASILLVNQLDRWLLVESYEHSEFIYPPWQEQPDPDDWCLHRKCLSRWSRSSGRLTDLMRLYWQLSSDYDELTTDNIKEPRSDETWGRYLTRFNKFYPPDEEGIHRTLFVRRLDYLIDLVSYCHLPVITLDDTIDTMSIPMTEKEKVDILKLWLEHHNWSELAFYKEWKFGLFAIYYYHKKAMKECANFDLPYHMTLEELLYK